MAQSCLPAGSIDAIRVALVDKCTEIPQAGANNGYLFNCFRNIAMTENIEEGDETTLKNDAGKKCWHTRKCDDIKDITIEFELLNPDYELTALLTGQPLINDGLENIGWYQEEGNNCLPWLSVELFEQVPDEDCTSPDKVYRRIVLPKVRFQLPTSEREDPFRLVKFTGRTSPALIENWSDGPFNDSAIDFAVAAPGVLSHKMEYFDANVTTPLVGACGYLAVPVQ